MRSVSRPRGSRYAPHFVRRYSTSGWSGAVATRPAGGVALSLLVRRVEWRCCYSPGGWSGVVATRPAGGVALLLLDHLVE